MCWEGSVARLRCLWRFHLPSLCPLPVPLAAHPRPPPTEQAAWSGALPPGSATPPAGISATLLAPSGRPGPSSRCPTRCPWRAPGGRAKLRTARRCPVRVPRERARLLACLGSGRAGVSGPRPRGRRSVCVAFVSGASLSRAVVLLAVTGARLWRAGVGTPRDPPRLKQTWRRRAPLPRRGRGRGLGFRVTPPWPLVPFPGKRAPLRTQLRFAGARASCKRSRSLSEAPPGSLMWRVASVTFMREIVSLFPAQIQFASNAAEALKRVAGSLVDTLLKVLHWCFSSCSRASQMCFVEELPRDAVWASCVLCTSSLSDSTPFCL